MKAKKTVLQVLECLRKHVVQLHQPTVMHISIWVMENFDVGYGKSCGGPHTIARQIESVINLRSVVSRGQA